MTARFYLRDYEQTDMLSGSTLTMSAVVCLRLHCQILLSLAQSLRYNVQSKCQDKKIMSKSYQNLL
jgi:hypothetical protein